MSNLPVYPLLLLFGLASPEEFGVSSLYTARLCVWRVSFGSQGLCVKIFLSGLWLYLDGNRDSGEHLRTAVTAIYELELPVLITELMVCV